MIILQKTKPVKLISIESAATSVSANVTATGSIDWLKNDGFYDIAFTLTHPDGDTQAFTLQSGEFVTEPYLFKKVAFVLTSAVAGASEFRMRAHVEGVN